MILGWIVRDRDSSPAQFTRYDVVSSHNGFCKQDQFCSAIHFSPVSVDPYASNRPDKANIVIAAKHASRFMLPTI